MLFILSVLGITLDLIGAVPATKYYSSKYEHIDVESILNNRRMVKYYSACLLSKGPCPPEGVDLKRILPEALQTNCGRCTEKQAAGALRAIRRLKKEYPKIWAQLSEQWDPDDIYVKKFESTFVPQKFNEIEPVVIIDRFDETAAAAATSPPIDGSASTIITKLIDSTSTSATVISTKSITESSTTSSSTAIGSTVSARSTSTSSTTLRSTSTAKPTRDPFDILLITNPPFRPNASFDFNIGSNIGATVKAIKRIEHLIASAAIEKLSLLKNILRIG